MNQLNTTNPEYLTWQYEEITFSIMGGIRLEGLDRLRVTVKVQFNDTAIRHNLDFYNDTQLNKLIKKCAERFEISSLYMSKAINDLLNLLEDYRMEEIKAEAASQLKNKKVLTEKEVRAAQAFLEQSSLLEETNKLIGQSGIVGEVDNRLLLYLIFTSRKQENPLHAISLASSGMGKSHLQERVAMLLPEEDVIEITTLSENAFYYFGQRELGHKLILIEDLEGAESALYPIRELQSKKRISKTVAKKDSRGETRTVHLTVEGPVCIAGCTTKEQVYEDNSNRSFLIYIDESPEQDERVMNYQRMLSAGKVNTDMEHQAREILKNTQCVLEPVKVINPYAELLHIPREVFKPRRSNSHYLQFIEAITFYHQKQRTQKVNKETGEVYIESTLEDIENANHLLRTVLLRKSDQLTGACRNYFERLKLYLVGEDGKKQVTNSEISRLFRIPLTTVKRYHFDLSNNGYLKAVKQKGGKAYYFEVVSYEEYQELQKLIGSVLDESLENLKKNLVKKAKPKSPKQTSSKSGLVSDQKNKQLDTIAH